MQLAPALNQTYGWGCESGDAYGSGTSFDSGVGTNQADVDVWKVYSAVGDHSGAGAHTSQLGCSDTWTSCNYTDSSGTVFDGNSGWTATDSYSCNSGACGSYGVDHSIAQTDGTTSLKASPFEVSDSSGRLGGPLDIGIVPEIECDRTYRVLMCNYAKACAKS